jgi:MoaA/NifB/PqqE/SkfB family radical SAM enzyme
VALRSLNLAVNDYCNFGCAMCHIWENPRVDHFDAAALARAVSHERSALAEVEELSITGGEVFLRSDLVDLVEATIPHLPALDRLFINTNGSFGDETVRFATTFAGRVRSLFVCVSIDGEPAFHDRLRGMPQSHAACVRLIERLTGLNLANLRVVISTTLVDGKHARASLEHVHDLARLYGCELTFRVAAQSETYYRNGPFKASLTPDAIVDIVAFIDRHYPDNPFFSALRAVLNGGRNPVMLDAADRLRCRAGDSFVFVQANGVVRPCIYSSRALGTLAEGLHATRLNDLGLHEPCPCCTECTIYPMLMSERTAVSG